MNSLDFLYSETYHPAMPVLEMSIDGYSGRPPRALKTLIDSGADGTMIPIDILEAVDALYEDTVQMRGVLGESELVDRHTVAIHIGPLTIHGIHAVAIPTGEDGIVGRDVQNTLAMTLNGPDNVTQIALNES